jgi:NAD(P)H-hydrate repair Nnr-like enzyme with NAD(P)H-hydrate dehydratase domain
MYDAAHSTTFVMKGKQNFEGASDLCGTCAAFVGAGLVPARVALQITSLF